MGLKQSIQDKEDGSERERTINNQGTIQTKYNDTNIYVCIFICHKNVITTYQQLK